MSADIAVLFGADTGPLEEAFARAKAEANATAREMAALAKQMQATGASADSELGQKLSSVARHLAEVKGQVAESGAALREHSAILKESGEAALVSAENLSQLREGFSRLAEIAGIAIGVDAFKEWVSSTTEAAENIERSAAKLGASTHDVQEIGAVAKLTGGDFEQMSLQLERMQLQLARATKETAPAAAALKSLGLSAQEFRQLPIPQQLEELAGAFSRFADGPTKTADAMALLGRAGADMIPYLDRGKEGIAELKKTAEETGVVLSQQDVKALAETAEASKKLGLAIKALGQDITLGLNGPIQKSIEFLAKFVELLNGAAKLARSFGGFGKFIGMTEAGLSVEGNDALLAKAASIPTDLGGNITVHPKPRAPAMQLGGGRGGRSKGDSGADTAARDAFSDEMDDARQAAKTEEDTLNNLVRQHKISWGQWAADTKAALEQEKAAIEAAANHALASAALTSQQKIEIMQREKDALAEIARQEADAQTKAAEESAKAWEKFFQPLNSAIESQIGGLVKGTESLRTAFAKTLEAMTQDLAKFAANTALKGIESMLTGGASGSGGGGLALGGGGGGGGAAGGLLGGLFSSVLGGAGHAAASGIGSDAVAALGGGAAAAGGGLGGVFSMFGPLLPLLGFDSGSWEIPHDMVAGVHAGEMIVPAQGGVADQFRSFLGSGSGPGGGDTHFHFSPQISAIDQGSVRSFFGNNSGPMLKAFNDAVGRGDHLGFKNLR